ncbi:MAG: DUF6600 domain-containing protein [Nitrospirota bacterium]
MRSNKYLMLLVFLMFPMAVLASDMGLMRVSLIEGDVQVLIKDTTDWTDAATNIPLNEGDRLWVPDGGKAEFQIRGGVFVRGDGNTALDILSADPASAQFYLDRGHAYINNRRGGIKIVQIDTPLSSVRSYDNSVMMLDVSEDGVTELSVLKGYVTVESRAGATRVGAGRTLTVRGEKDAELAPIDAPDEWERWNTDRDRKVTTWGESARYLPDELHEYSADFDDNGRWDYTGDYGYVWVPAVTVADWAPYTLGRWVWIRGNYVWIAYDPWGWAPYHYGRWVFAASRGWCWVPPVAGGVYWSPGFVGWIVTPGYVAWVPLAPGEVYYGYGYYGPGSVNITTINISTVVVNRTYVNARHGHAVTVVKRDTFGTGRREFVRTEGNPFLQAHREHEQDIVVAPPQVRPTRPIVLVPPEARDQARQRQRPPEREHVRQEIPATRHEPPPSMRTEQPPRTPAVPPAVRTERQRETPPMVQQRHVPPERVQKNRPDVLKSERRLVKEREGSVFRQQAPENLPVKRSNEPKVIIRNPAKQQGEQTNKKNDGERRDRREGR